MIDLMRHLHFLVRKDLQEMASNGGSLMPEGVGEVLSKRDLRNLVEFLASQQQLP